MGSSWSKIAAVPSTPKSKGKADPCQQIIHEQVARLMDPRSPSAGVDRTPIQVGLSVSKTSVEVKSECALPNDPRSPSVDISRTPMKDVMRVTVGSFAHRLGMLFQSEATDKAPVLDQRSSKILAEEIDVDEELGSSEPLLTTQPPQNFGSMADHANLLSTPVKHSLQNLSDLSPFVLLNEPQVEVEVETEADVTVEEAEEARETPLHKRLSMSLITCLEGAVPSQIFADVHHECPLPSVDVEPLWDGTDHSCALPSITSDPECPLTPVQHSTPTVSDVALVTASPEEPVQIPSVEAETPVPEKFPLPPTTATPIQPSPAPGPAPSQEQPQLSTGIRCPTFDTKSPSQVVFKPQWLGKGFGASGLRARGLQARAGKGGSSPLAVRLAVKNVSNENKGQSSKLKPKGNGLAEGRSPLQILKETNSPRDLPSQMKLKVSTPDGQRSGQMERRVLTVSLDKENR